MYNFGKTSKQKLDTCHPRLVAIANRALELSPYDFTIIHGWRGREVQNALFESNASTKQFPHSMHNNVDAQSQPCSLAIDFAPWIGNKVDWTDIPIFSCLAGCFHAAASQLEERIRWGADWQTDGSIKNDTLLDYGHIEIIL